MQNIQRLPTETETRYARHGRQSPGPAGPGHRAGVRPCLPGDVEAVPRSTGRQSQRPSGRLCNSSQMVRSLVRARLRAAPVPRDGPADRAQHASPSSGRRTRWQPNATATSSLRVVTRTAQPAWPGNSGATRDGLLTSSSTMSASLVRQQVAHGGGPALHVGESAVVMAIGLGPTVENVHGIAHLRMRPQDPVSEMRLAGAARRGPPALSCRCRPSRPGPQAVTSPSTSSSCSVANSSARPTKLAGTARRLERSASVCASSARPGLAWVVNERHSSSLMGAQPHSVFQNVPDRLKLFRV